MLVSQQSSRFTHHSEFKIPIKNNFKITIQFMNMIDQDAELKFLEFWMNGQTDDRLLTRQESKWAVSLSIKSSLMTVIDGNKYI